MEDYHQGVVFPLVNRDTSFLLILIVCNNTLGYGDGPDIGIGRRTPELSIRECVQDALCCMHELGSMPRVTYESTHFVSHGAMSLESHLKAPLRQTATCLS